MLKVIRRIHPLLEGLYKTTQPQRVSKLPDLMSKSQLGHFGYNDLFVQNRKFSISSSLLKHEKPLPDDHVIFIDAKGREIPITYQEIVEKAGERKVVRVITTKTKTDTPRFKIMSDVDLEIALRKQKTEINYLGKKEILETDEGRIKQKSLKLSEKMSDHDLQAQLGKIKKMLVKGDFVLVNVKTNDKTGPKYLELKKKVFDYFKDEEELLGQNNVKLQFK